MAGCDGALVTGRTLAALAAAERRRAPRRRRRDASSAASRPGAARRHVRLRHAARPGGRDRLAGRRPRPRASTRLGSLAAFGPDGVIPLTLAVNAGKAEVQPLDDNAFTVTLRNPNAGRRAGRLDRRRPRRRLGLHRRRRRTGSDHRQPDRSQGNVATWTGDLTVAGHGAGELRFAVTHRSGQRTATTTAPRPAAQFAASCRRAIADIGSAKATVDVRSIEGSKPEHGDHQRPDRRSTTNRDPAFELEASKDEGVSYECRFGDRAWAPCEGNPYRPGPLADGPYELEVRAEDAFGADETPAKRDVRRRHAARPTTVIASGPARHHHRHRPALQLRVQRGGRDVRVPLRRRRGSPRARRRSPAAGPGRRRASLRGRAPSTRRATSTRRRRCRRSASTRPRR